MLLKFIKSFAISFLVLIVYIVFFYSSGEQAPIKDKNQELELELASYESKIKELNEKEMNYNNLLQNLNTLKENRNSKISDMISSVELKSILREMSTIAKQHNLSISAFTVEPIDNNFFQENIISVKFRGSYDNIVSLLEDQNFLPTNAKIKKFNIVGPVSKSKYILTETELSFSLFKRISEQGDE